MEHKIAVSIQDRYLLVDSSIGWELCFNDNKVLKYGYGKYQVDLYVKIGSEGSGEDILKNVWIYYDDKDDPAVRFEWQTSEIPVQELTGVDGQKVQVSNWPEDQGVKVLNLPSVQDVNLVNIGALGKAMDSRAVSSVYPVGSIYLSFSSASPRDLFGMGVWKRIQGRFLVGVQDKDVQFGRPWADGGARTVTLSESQMPKHSHGIDGVGRNIDFHDNAISDGQGPSVQYSTKEAGGGQAHENLPPFVAVYMWYRES